MSQPASAEASSSNGVYDYADEITAESRATMQPAARVEPPVNRENKHSVPALYDCMAPIPRYDLFFVFKVALACYFYPVIVRKLVRLYVEHFVLIPARVIITTGTVRFYFKICSKTKIMIKCFFNG